MVKSSRKKFTNHKFGKRPASSFSPTNYGYRIPHTQTTYNLKKQLAVICSKRKFRLSFEVLPSRFGNRYYISVDLSIFNLGGDQIYKSSDLHFSTYNLEEKIGNSLKIGIDVVNNYGVSPVNNLSMDLLLSSSLIAYLSDKKSWSTQPTDPLDNLSDKKSWSTQPTDPLDNLSDKKSWPTQPTDNLRYPSKSSVLFNSKSLNNI